MYLIVPREVACHYHENLALGQDTRGGEEAVRTLNR